MRNCYNYMDLSFLLLLIAYTHLPWLIQYDKQVYFSYDKKSQWEISTGIILAI